MAELSTTMLRVLARFCACVLCLAIGQETNRSVVDSRVVRSSILRVRFGRAMTSFLEMFCAPARRFSSASRLPIAIEGGTAGNFEMGLLISPAGRSRSPQHGATRLSLSKSCVKSRQPFPLEPLPHCLLLRHRRSRAGSSDHECNLNETNVDQRDSARRSASRYC